MIQITIASADSQAEFTGVGTTRDEAIADARAQLIAAIRADRAQDPQESAEMDASGWTAEAEAEEWEPVE